MTWQNSGLNEKLPNPNIYPNHFLNNRNSDTIQKISEKRRISTHSIPNSTLMPILSGLCGWMHVPGEIHSCLDEIPMVTLGGWKKVLVGPPCGTDSPWSLHETPCLRIFSSFSAKLFYCHHKFPPPLSGLVAVMGIISDAKMPLFGVGARQQSDGKLRHQPCGGLLERLRTPGVAAA